MVITHKASLEGGGGGVFFFVCVGGGGGGGGVFYCVCVGWRGWSMIVKNVTSQYRMIMKEGGEHERVWCLSQPDCILPPSFHLLDYFHFCN